MLEDKKQEYGFDNLDDVIKKVQVNVDWLNNNNYLNFYRTLNGNKVKVGIKRIIRKFLSFLLFPLFEQQSQINDKILENISDLLDCNRYLYHDQMKLITIFHENRNRLNEECLQLQNLERNLDSLKQSIEYYNSYLSLAIQECRNTIEEYQERLACIEQMRTMVDELNLDFNNQNKYMEEAKNVCAAMARDLMRTKWKLRDHLEQLEDSSEHLLTCKICNYSAPEKSFEIKESDCIFEGGHLKRYVCPQCGCIFGPTKFSVQTKEEFSDDYIVHYAGFSEVDSTHKEIFAFQALAPNKNGVYLDYGCGKWSHTVYKLRQDGYIVYGYDPYAGDVDNPYIITDHETIRRMRFDGIFSNDLLEHLPDPISDLKFMKSLLRTPDSRMAHCTGCFLYKYEYTRFHMYFFTGNSLNILASRVGIQILGHKIEPATQDPCYLFGIMENFIDETHCMSTTCTRSLDSGLLAGPKDVIYGPGLILPEDDYLFIINIELPKGLDLVTCRVTTHRGQKLLQQFPLYNGENKYALHITNSDTGLEFVMQNPSNDGDLILKQIGILWENAK